MKSDYKEWLLQLQELIHLPFLIRTKGQLINLPYVKEDTYDEGYLKILIEQKFHYPIQILKLHRDIYMQIEIDQDIYIISYQNRVKEFLYEEKYNFLLRSMAFVYYSYTKQTLDISGYLYEKSETAIKTSEIIEEMIQVREEEQYHVDYINELYIRSCVQRGDVEQLEKALEHFRRAGNVGVLDSRDSLRNKKNQIIPVITLTTRAAIEGGLPQEQAYKLSDLYIQNIESRERIDNVSSITYDILADFTRRVKQQKRKHLSKNIYVCQEYINSHLYEKLNLTMLADYLHMNASYLSSKFKEETGMTLIHYIHVQKISEAKQLLLMSKYQISEIYTLLNFTDQSHFNRIFKQIEGVTPNQFKESYLLK